MYVAKLTKLQKRLYNYLRYKYMKSFSKFFPFSLCYILCNNLVLSADINTENQYQLTQDAKNCSSYIFLEFNLAILHELLININTYKEDQNVFQVYQQTIIALQSGMAQLAVESPRVSNDGQLIFFNVSKERETRLRKRIYNISNEYRILKQNNYYYNKKLKIFSLLARVDFILESITDLMLNDSLK